MANRRVVPMPIRFRCTQCNQLMSIARRKAGTMIRCPTCSQAITVPNPAPHQAPGVDPLVFEASDFAKVLDIEEDLPVPAPVVPGPHASLGPDPLQDPKVSAPVPELVFEVGRAPVASPKRTGIHLSPVIATLLIVGIIAGLALAFGAGLLIGFLLRPA